MSIFKKIYNRINWQNKPSTETPINADNLNKMDKAIYDLDDRVVSLSESVETNTTDISDLQSDVNKKIEIHSFIGQLEFVNGMAQWEMGVHSGITHVTNVISVCGWGTNYTMSFSVADANVSNFSIYVFASNGSGIANSVLSFRCFYTID